MRLALTLALGAGLYLAALAIAEWAWGKDRVRQFGEDWLS